MVPSSKCNQYMISVIFLLVFVRFYLFAIILYVKIINKNFIYIYKNIY